MTLYLIPLFYFSQCKSVANAGFRGGNYECHCRAGFYFPALNATQKYFSGTSLERHVIKTNQNGGNRSEGISDFQCLPCHQRCVDCDNEGPCYVEYNIFLRGIPLGIQSFCMTISLVLAILVLRLRKCKVCMICLEKCLYLI